MCIHYRDEPALKATFTLTLVVDQHLTALSNMPEGKCMCSNVLYIHITDSCSIDATMHTALLLTTLIICAGCEVYSFP